MPLLSIEEVCPNVRLGLWEMSESIECLCEKYPFLFKERDLIFKLYKSDNRRLEVLTELLILHEMLGNNVRLLHNKNGEPFLSDGQFVSISHTKGIVAVMISSCNRVSVDVEFISKRVNNIASRFLRKDEKADTLIQKLIHWCTKETLYKLYTEDKLSFNDMKLLSVDGNNIRGIIVAKNLYCNENINVSYRIFGNILLTYAIIDKQQ